jgi:hypothetical protein
MRAWSAVFPVVWAEAGHRTNNEAAVIAAIATPSMVRRFLIETPSFVTLVIPLITSVTRLARLP